MCLVISIYCKAGCDSYVSVFHSAEEEGPESDDEEEEDDNDVSPALAQLDIDKFNTITQLIY